MTQPTSPDPADRPVRAPEVVDITVDRPSMELRLMFADRTEGSINLMELRLHCPCATCRAARQQGREGWPLPSGPDTLSLESAQLVGAWGLGITWNDGHATGIYPFDALHAWIVAGQPVVTPDSGLGG